MIRFRYGDLQIAKRDETEGMIVRRGHWRKIKRGIPWGVDVRTVVYQQVDNLVISTRAGNVDGEDPVEDRIDWLSVSESVSDEAIIS